jgi:hypothetical protein
MQGQAAGCSPLNPSEWTYSRWCPNRKLPSSCVCASAVTAARVWDIMYWATADSAAVLQRLV